VLKTHARAVLFGAGSPILVDIEETCLRRGIEVVAIINNYDGPSYALQLEKELKLPEMPIALLEHALVFPLFTPGYRKAAYDQAVTLGARCFEPLIDPTAILPMSLQMAEGVYVNCGVTFGGKSVLGAFSFINRSASLGHHASLADFASVGPGAVLGGHVTVGRGAVIGTGAIILPGISVGANSVVGAGSVVARDVPDNTLVMGNPARITQRNILGYHGVGI
jgi:UDP-3-O-[3-hydroxymyristoyl] glucosamine N-acyltransferase